MRRHLPIVLERDLFLRTLLRELAGTLEEVVGEQEAAGFVSVVGQRVGDWINGMYRSALGVEKLDRESVADVLVDLKRRIQGDFYLMDATESRIILGNRACPFGEHVRDRNSLCMMTSNVFGTITADNLGYARVELQNTIARGDPECVIVVNLANAQPGEPAHGREYFGPA